MNASLSKRRAAVSSVLVAMLALTACGTRMDHDDIVGAGAVTVGPGGVLLDAEGNVIADDSAIGGSAGLPGSASGVGGTSGVGGDAGTGSTAGGGASSGDGAGDSGEGSPEIGDGEPILIGSIGTYSGLVGGAATPGLTALRVWVAAVNAQGGVAGHPIELVVYDDGGDGAKALSQAKEFVEERKGLAIVDSFSALTAGSFRSYVEEQKMPVIGGDCGTTEFGDSFMFFNPCAKPQTQVAQIVRAGAQYGKGDQWGLLYCTEAAACGQAKELLVDDGVAEDAGLEVAYSASISLAQPDFTAECVNARNAGVELFTVIADGATVSRVAAACDRQNFNPQFLQGSSLVTSGMPRQAGLSDVIASTPVFPFEGATSPAIGEFQAAWEKYSGGADYHPNAALGWAGAKLFEKAVEGISGEVTTESLLASLASLRNETLGGLTGPMNFPAGKPTVDSRCAFTMLADGGKWTAVNGGKPIC